MVGGHRFHGRLHTTAGRYRVRITANDRFQNDAFGPLKALFGCVRGRPTDRTLPGPAPVRQCGRARRDRRETASPTPRTRSALLSAFEERVALLDYDRIEVGSAGGYVDDFYRGHQPDSILVCLDPSESSPPDRHAEYAVLEDRVDNGQRHISGGVDGVDNPSVEEIRGAFDDPAASFILTKPLDPEDSGPE